MREKMSLNSGMANSLKNGVLPPNHRELIRVAERKRVDRLDLATSTPERVPLPPYHREKGGTKVPHGKYSESITHLLSTVCQNRLAM